MAQTAAQKKAAQQAAQQKAQQSRLDQIYKSITDLALDFTGLRQAQAAQSAVENQRAANAATQAPSAAGIPGWAVALAVVLGLFFLFRK